MDADHGKAAQFSIDPESVASARAELREIVKGIPIAEAAAEGFNDWQAIEAMERLQAAEPMPREAGSDSGREPQDWLAVLLPE
jgi:hypothetical protein